MDKKKKIIIGISVAILILVVILILAFNKKPNKPDNNSNSNSNITSNVEEEVIVKFDSAGGKDVSEVKVKKSNSINLPVTTREGYNFLGWYKGEEQVTNNTKFDSNTTLLAHWEEIPKDAKTFVIKYDTDGGSEISDVTVECGKGLRFPTKPTKEGYKFVNWTNKSGKVVLEGAKLACEDVTLKAKWEKIEQKSNEVKSNTTDEKKYTCTEGTVDGNKCVSSEDAKEKCPDGTKEDGDKCIKITDYTQGERTCPKVYIEGHDYQGTKLDAGTTFCLYAPYSSIETKEECESISNGLSIDKDGHYDWSGGKCYKAVLQNYETTCSSGYEYYSSADILNKFGGHNNGGCYRSVAKTKYCDKEGYTLSGSKCIKIADAELK